MFGQGGNHLVERQHDHEQQDQQHHRRRRPAAATETLLEAQQLRPRRHHDRGGPDQPGQERTQEDVYSPAAPGKAGRLAR
ncbi:hypothetical protein G6F32_016690 [Rhizopus arrhizus]|nr:hypothetical protein G6F32_016690 [Rhizopus arrhizus]